jgi:DNA adenine methylase
MNTIIQPFIKWSGGKKSQAKEIVKFFPENIEVYYEPFLGGGAVLGFLKPKKATCGDAYVPLIKLWELIKNNPKKVIIKYKENWNNLQNTDYKYYYHVREKFNKKGEPTDLLFLSRTCVNGLIRFNKDGKFNNSLHYTRKGMDPARLEKIIIEWYKLIKKYKFCPHDYKETTRNAKKGDFIYLDPPYFYNKGRYSQDLDYEKLLEYLKELNNKNIKFALSFDGQRGEKNYQIEIPKNLYKRHILLHSGDSTFNKIQNKKIETVHESLYMNY